MSEEKQHSAHLKRIGHEYTGPCPVCGGQDRFSINQSKQLFNCRGCGKGGDVIALVQHVGGVGLFDAIRDLNCGKVEQPRPRAAVRPPEPPPASPAATTTSDALAMWREGVEPRGSVVERYLNSRGLELTRG